MNIRIFENNVWLRNVQCISIGCKNVLLCEDFCVGFIPKIETLIWEDEINPLGNNAEELKDYPDEDPKDYSQDYEHDPMDCYHQIEDLLIETREILDRIEAR